jgi:hypothetical protein
LDGIINQLIGIWGHHPVDLSKYEILDDIGIIPAILLEFVGGKDCNPWAGNLSHSDTGLPSGKLT